MIETIILGKLTKINPFNQPAVEQVKKLTKSLVKKFQNNFGSAIYFFKYYV